MWYKVRKLPCHKRKNVLYYMVDKFGEGTGYVFLVLTPFPVVVGEGLVECVLFGLLAVT